MKHNELIEKITTQLGRTPKQRELAQILNKPVGTINSRASRNLQYTNEEIKKLADFFKVDFNTEIVDKIKKNLHDFPVINYFYATWYPEKVGFYSNGMFLDVCEKRTITLPKKLVNSYSHEKKYAVINACDESMEPTILNSDLLIVERLKNEITENNQIYVFFYNKQLYVKRVIKDINELIIKSDNPDPIYKIQMIEKEDLQNVYIFGRVVGIMREI